MENAFGAYTKIRMSYLESICNHVECKDLSSTNDGWITFLKMKQWFLAPNTTPLS